MKISKTFLDRLYERKHKLMVLLCQVESLSTDEPAHAPTAQDVLKERVTGLQGSIRSAESMIASYLSDHS